MFVIGTAGHVDHGKSVLVHALTGIDPDRLQEEKERGMSIDLGFAWFKLPSDKEVSIIDVPGHERFVKNMLAGIGGIDLALLVIAADEGVMPQTREHLAILDLLQVKSGVLVIAKKDLVDEDWLELVSSDVEEAVKGTTLAQAPLVAVSALTGEGLPDLVSTIDSLLESTPQRRDIGRPRLPVDRVFTIAGFGTVVTGTLSDGCFSIGQEVEILPSRLKARIRGLQTHKQKMEVAKPGSRVATNLAGVATAELKRGDVVTTPGWLRPTIALDIRLRLLSDLPHPTPHNATVIFHTGPSEVIGKIRLLEKAELKPGETTWAQVRLSRPIAAVKGDFFIIRSAQGTIGGGEVIDPYAKRHRRFHPATIESLAILERGSPKEIVLKTLEEAEPCELGALLKRLSLPQNEAKAALESLASEEKAVVLGGKGLELTTVLFSSPGWGRFLEKARMAVETYHQQFPLRLGMPKEELKSRLRTPARAFAQATNRLVQDNALVEEGALVRLPTYEIRLTRAQQAAVDAFLDSLARSPYSPPGELVPEPELLNMLIEQGKVVRVSENVIFSTSAYEEMVRKVTQEIKSQGKITVARVRDLFNTSRKYALALMEHLDERKVTRRVGDERVLR